MLKNILTVYKINLPFGEGSSYDKAKYNYIKDNFIWGFKYDKIFIKEENQKFGEFEIIKIYFDGGFIKMLFYYEKYHLFLPSFQIDLFSEKKLDNKFLKNFYEIFLNLGIDNFIFDLISKKIDINNSKILTDYKLAEYFKDFNEENIYNFFTKIDKVFISQELEQNKKIKYQLYYLLFLNYKLFKNILLSDGGIYKLEKLIGEDIDDKLLTELTLTKERIKFISDINLVVFKKYKELLEKFMELLK